MDVQKRKSNYFSNNRNNQKRRKQFNLEPGMTGFLCTCNFREKDCIRDAYKLLNEFADEIYGQDNAKESNVSKAKDLKTDTETMKDEPNDKSENEDDDDDISTALNKEINELKAEYTKPVADRRFQVVDTRVKNVVFIRSTLDNPLELVTKIVTDLDKTKQQRTRFILRLLPIQVACKAYMDDIKQKADVLFEKYFAQEPKTFSIVFNRHSNNNIQRDEIIEDLAELITKKNPGNRADLKNPELAVVVEVIRATCLIAIAPNYFRFKKYNLLEICNAKEVKTEPKKTYTEECKDVGPKTEKQEEVPKDKNDLSKEMSNEVKEVKSDAKKTYTEECKDPEPETENQTLVPKGNSEMSGKGKGTND